MIACGPQPQLKPPVFGRVIKLAALGNPHEAGCFLVGKNGRSIETLVIAAGGLQRYVDEVEGNPVRAVVLARADGRQEHPAGFSLRFSLGKQAAPKAYRLLPSEGDDGLFPEVHRDSEGWISATGNSFILPMPIFDDLLVKFRLKATALEGRLSIENDALTSKLLLTGYLDRPGLSAVVDQVLKACQATRAPQVCGLVERTFGADPQPEDLMREVLKQIGGFDAAIVDGRPDFCGDGRPRACDAVGMCVQLELGATTLVE